MGRTRSRWRSAVVAAAAPALTVAAVGTPAVTATLAVAAVATLAVTATPAAAQQAPGFWTTPAIQGYGPVHTWPESSVRPDPAGTYKAVFDVTQAGKGKNDVNSALDHVARAINAFASAGVPLDHLKFAVIIHGPATPVVLNEETFQAKFHRANPDRAVIEALQKAGVNVMVCGNALADWGYTPGQILPNVKVALAALATVIMLQNEGYAVLRM